MFVSFASVNQKKALDLCKSLEERGVACWISCRDVPPGANYQEAIVRAIQGARGMVLVFSKAANSSDEIKKELSLASRYRIPLLAVRIQNAQATDAFAYELSTRQWIDAFHGWDEAIDRVVSSLHQSADRRAPDFHATHVARLPKPRALAFAAAIAVLLTATAGWVLLRPHSAATHTMQVRLTDFKSLSPNLPATLPQVIRDEITASFGAEGEVTVSTARAPPPGSAPAYSLGGTIRRDGDTVRIVANLVSDRTGTTLWSDESTYPAKTTDKLPRWFALKVSGVARCGLFGASTYPGQLPEGTLSDYFQACWSKTPTGQLDAARRAAKATPDFSPAWSAIQSDAFALAQQNNGSDREALLKEASAAYDQAIRFDPQNSEAYASRALSMPHKDLAGREALYKKALAARPLACGCEHHMYALFLREVGKNRAALGQYMRALDFVPLDPNTNAELGFLAILDGGSRQEIQNHFNAAADSLPDPEFLDDIKIEAAPFTGDYRSSLEVLKSGREPGIPPAFQAALIAVSKAMISGNSGAKAKAAAMITALPQEVQGQLTVLLLGALGANKEALAQLEALDAAGKTIKARSWLWAPSMEGAIRDPAFPAVADRLGLLKYWRTAHTQPDACSGKDRPPFCRMIQT